MDLEKNLFAKSDLTPMVRFITALKISSKKFCHRKWNAPAILYAIGRDIEKDFKKFSYAQRNAIGNIGFSEANSHEIRAMFIELYHDDDTLVAYLNGKITDLSIKRYGRSGIYAVDEAKDITKRIIETDILEGLDLSF